MSSPHRKNKYLTVREIAVFSMLGTLMFLGDLLMEWAPNVHFVGVLCMTYTAVYRAKALIPLYIYIVLNGVYAGFSLWWMPYIYIWLPIWGGAMLFPRKMSMPLFVFFSATVCALHGFAFGVLYAPAQALMFGFDFKTTLAWIISGLPFDAVHGVANFAASFIIIPLVTVLCKLEHKPLPYKINKL